MIHEHERLRNRAHHAVQEALYKGVLKRQPCEVCGDAIGVTHAHHEDYTKPLDVLWLCNQHHQWLHLAQRKGWYSPERVSHIESFVRLLAKLGLETIVVRKGAAA